MKLFGKDLERDVAIVAEIGVNHEGSVETALMLVELAHQAGADAVKFQSYTPERFVAAADAERLARIRRFQLDLADHHKVAKRAAELGMAFFSTPVTEDWVAQLDPLVPAFKIASGDLTFEPVIRAAAATGKPVVLSTGLGTIEEIDRAVEWIRQEIAPADLADRLVLMHCVSAYPTPMEQAAVRAVPFLKARYGVSVGYSNHVIGTEACLAAVALGAQVLEVHFTDRKTGRDFRDHSLSFEPNELAGLVESVKKVRACLGPEGKSRMPCEEGAVLAVRKGIVAATSLRAGTNLAADDLMFARPATEFTSNDLALVIGHKLLTDKNPGEQIMRADIE